MKKLVIVALVLAAVLLVAPFGIGKLAEKRLNSGLDKLVEQAPYFKISERTWSGGWFRSTQTVTFTLSDAFSDKLGKKVIDDIFKKESAEANAAMDAAGTESAPESDAPGSEAAAAAGAGSTPAPEAAPEASPGKPAKPLTFTVRNEVLHGPVLGAAGLGLARVDTHLELNDEIRKEIEEVFGKEPAVTVSTRVGFFGGGTTTFKSEGRKLNIKDKNVDFSYDTFKLAVNASKNADSYDIDGKLPSVTVHDKGDDTHFSLKDLTMDGDGERVRGDLYDGDFAFKIKEIKFKKGAESEMAIEDAHYVVDTRTKDDFVNIAAQFGTGAIKSDQLKQVNVDVKEIHYNFSLNHLHAPTLEKILLGMKSMYNTPLADPSQVENAVFGPMKENAGELLKHDPEFGIDRVGLVTPDGEIVAKGKVKLVGATPEDFSAPGGMALVGKLDADITIEASQKVLEKFPNGATMAGGAVDAGYAKRDGDKLVCHITFRAGSLLINGKPQAIPGLTGPPPGATEDSGTSPQE